MNIHGCIPRFIKAHGSLILTILSGIGLIGTVTVTARQAPKAEKALRDALEEKIETATDEMMQADTSLTLSEKIRTAGPFYAPVILLGLATMGCMAGAQILNAKQQAAMTLAYAMLSQDFGAYRQEIRNEYGVEADRKVYTNSQKKIETLEEEIRRLEAIKGVLTFGIATIPGLIFRSDMANIECAFLHFNRNLAIRGENTLDELYTFLGIPAWNALLDSDAHPNAIYGWNEYANEVNWDCAFVDYQLEKIQPSYGDPIYLINFAVPPYLLEGMDFGYGDDSFEHVYPGYLPEAAREMLRKGAETVPMLIDSASHPVDYPGMGESAY